ncbi:nucleolar protein 12-like [Vicia villosa]|uniref:nucleolar protein 12-like n=1 Tax=Vicia villosa TaxID=3911 RepID=UPI00273A7DFF|nr:nucleolar protein 12-like [Vicia villosa]
MAKKKQKEPQQTPKNDTVSSSSSVFDVLFGNAPEQITGTAASLFSDDNPFKRKPPQPALISDVTDHTPNSENGDVDEKKRKRNKEKNPVLDSNSAIKVSEKKKKKKSGLNEKEGEEKEKEHILDVETIGKEKKKRKRDEVEKEWEEKKYGIVKGGDKDEREGFENEKVGSKRKVRDNPADMMVSKKGFDDEDKLLRTIFVGNLPLKVKKKTLLNEFKKFGEVESVRIRSVPLQDTKIPRKGAILAKKIHELAESVNAYIVFKTEESAQASLAHNMTVVEGFHIRVDRACPPRKKLKGDTSQLYDNKRTVFVGNLPFDVKDEELYQLFGGIPNLESSVEAIRVVRDPHLNVGKGIAYVLFKTREAANSIVNKRSLNLRDRALRLSRANTNAATTPSKRPDSPGARLTHGKPNATPSKRPYTPAAQAHRTPVKKFSAASKSPSSSKNGSNRKTTASYQGLRATKSDVFKKSHGGEKPKVRTQKRPTVAARKAKAKVQQEGGTPKHAGSKGTPKKAGSKGTPKQAGSKRKFDSRTPDSSGRVMKAQKKW